jgi:hypothetical protein
MNAAVSGLDPRATTPVSDLSETGVFVHTEEPLAIGSDIELCFTVSLGTGIDEPVLFQGHGRVVRHGDDPMGMGVEFVDLDESARDVVRKMLLRDEAARSRPNMAVADTSLRTHGLVARLLGSKK